MLGWFWRLLWPQTYKFTFRFPAHEGRDKEGLMFVRSGAGDSSGMNAQFVPEIKAWCKANLKRGYRINGGWDTSTYLNDIELVPTFHVRFANERDAILFKLRWT